MLAVLYQGYIKKGKEQEYQDAWHIIAHYFVSEKGALGSCLHRSKDGLWVAYSRWPDRKTREKAWPGENDPSQDLPEEIKKAILSLRNCIETQLPEICMEVVDDLLT